MPRQRIVSPPREELDQLRTPLTPGERRVFELFDRLLPVEWEIYVQPHLNGLRPDFVLLNPRVGIAVFEVKDWNLDAMQYSVERTGGLPSLIADNGMAHFRLGKQEPVSRVAAYKEMIMKLLCPRLDAVVGAAAITCGIIFTKEKTARVSALLQPLRAALGMLAPKAARYYPVSGVDDLERGNLAAIFPEWNRSFTRVFDASHAQDFRAWLTEPSVASDQRLPLQLDPKQRELAMTRPANGYRRIKGSAGSGKSQVLAARAAELISQGKRVLVLAYNITLLHYLGDLAVRHHRGARKYGDWLHFHLWCSVMFGECGRYSDYYALWDAFSDRARDMGPDAKEQALTTMLEETIPSALEAVLLDCNASDRQLYDAILVDEGQDFLPLWWNTLRLTLKPDGEMLLCADQSQDIYNTAIRWTDQAMTGAGFRGPWNVLEKSYRLPQDYIPAIRQFAEVFLPAETRMLPEPVGELPLMPCRVRWVQIPNMKSVPACADEITRIVKEPGIERQSAADVVFLTPSLKHGFAVVETLQRSRGYRFAHTFAESKNECRRLKHEFYLGDARLKATTIHSFKGYEARTLVVYIGAGDPAKLAPLVYAAITRVKEQSQGSAITVVCSNAAFREYGRTWGEYVELTEDKTPLRSSDTRMPATTQIQSRPPESSSHPIRRFKQGTVECEPRQRAMLHTSVSGRV